MIRANDDGDGACVVLLHAFPCDRRLWQPQAQVLVDAGFRVVVPDLPGFGSSGLPDAEPSLAAVAQLIVDYLDSLGIQRCILGGVSLGGYVAMAMLRVRPELAGAALLCGTKATADSDEAAANRERLASMVDARPLDCARILDQALFPGLLGPTTRASRPEVVEVVQGWLSDARPDAVAWYQRAMAQRPDSRDVLAELEAPALVVWGAEDGLISYPEQELMLEALRDGTLHTVAGAGHLTGIELPAEVNDVVLRFAESVRGQRPS